MSPARGSAARFDIPGVHLAAHLDLQRDDGVERAGARVIRILRDDADRPVGGPLWPLVRLYYRLFGINPYVELVAARGDGT